MEKAASLGHALLVLAVLALAQLGPHRAWAQSKAMREIAQPVKPAPTKAEARRRIENYLNSIDTPIPEQTWRALGPNGVIVLDEIARDKKRLPTDRAQAVTALGMVDGASPRATGLMIEIAKRESEPSVVRTAALRALGDALSADRVLPTLQPLLATAKNHRVRAAAAEALTRRNPEAACGPVRLQLNRESSGQRPAFASAMKACDAAVKKTDQPAGALKN
jgi:HEAT repeat protein